jgi:hypothetical protein
VEDSLWDHLAQPIQHLEKVLVCRFIETACRRLRNMYRPMEEFGMQWMDLEVTLLCIGTNHGRCDQTWNDFSYP